MGVTGPSLLLSLFNTLHQLLLNSAPLRCVNPPHSLTHPRYPSSSPVQTEQLASRTAAGCGWDGRPCVNTSTPCRVVRGVRVATAHCRVSSTHTHTSPNARLGATPSLRIRQPLRAAVAVSCSHVWVHGGAVWERMQPSGLAVGVSVGIPPTHRSIYEQRPCMRCALVGATT